MTLNLIKLCVGCDTVEELLIWWRASHDEGQPWVMRTRQTPRRAAELIDGGSLYRVYKGFILSRQRILAVDTVGVGPAARCAVTLDQAVMLTLPTPRRAFQGWRYLDPKDAPADVYAADAGESVPMELARRLREIGAW
ncbi:MAG: DUF1489 domain-containing protein [Caulobacteraceae bacterium]|nr:DUF1489 domain-containing protein [Caulobacteraceae bacterium]